MRIILVNLALIMLAVTSMAQEPLHIMSFNIRLNTPGDGENAWPYRKTFVAEQITRNQVHILGVQEALHGQMEDLCQSLSGYKYVGVGRDDGRQQGEYSAIFYDTARITVRNSGTFWLSETPDIPGSKSWDAAITRVATWAEAVDVTTGKIFFVFNTHFDHIGKEARNQSAQLLLLKMKEIAGEQPVLLTGDFNSTPADAPILTLTDKSKDYHLTNSFHQSKKKPEGPAGTFNGWKTSSLPDQPIDFIFFRGNFQVKHHITLMEKRDGRFSSDHFPVWIAVKQK